jgi:hypothetical protein
MLGNCSVKSFPDKLAYLTVEVIRCKQGIVRRHPFPRAALALPTHLTGRVRLSPLATRSPIFLHQLVPAPNRCTAVKLASVVKSSFASYVGLLEIP